MRTKNFETIVEFADWYFSTILPEVRYFKSDCFNDASLIMNERNEAFKNKFSEIKKTYFLFVRKNGTNLVHESSRYLHSYAKSNENVYQIDFCFNSDYFLSPFAKVKKLEISNFL